MTVENLVLTTTDFVKEYLKDAEAGHNWWHIFRVRNMAVYINLVENSGNPEIIELASLLHDIGDHKTGKGGNGPEIVCRFLKDQGLSTIKIDKIVFIIENISFRDRFNNIEKRIPELDIVQDADRLDAIGAIGIARAFQYGGSRNNDIYVPGTGPKTYNSKDEYTTSRSSTINHFDEKLLLLKDLMNTMTGKSMAEERHRYMEQFLEQFHREWNLNGKKVE